MKLKTIGMAFIAIGVLVALYAWNMPVSHGSAVVNIHLLNERQNTLMLGGILFIAGIILFSTFKIKQTDKDVAIETENFARSKQKVHSHLERVAYSTSSYMQFLKSIYGKAVDAEGVYVSAWQDHRVARIVTGTIVGILLTLIFIFSSFFLELFFGFHLALTLIALPLVLWLSFRPRSASSVIIRINYLCIAITGVLCLYEFYKTPTHMVDVGDREVTLEVASTGLDEPPNSEKESNGSDLFLTPEGSPIEKLIFVFVISGSLILYAKKKLTA